ncbi:MAG: response regulator transcription factor [Solirubrobacterales bacterium]|nr:response regulator transcription factor [Solirubrobacterales bacterium]MBV9715641.1 response regulator transcription factor [Solirubrobacterales bacterium]
MRNLFPAIAHNVTVPSHILVIEDEPGIVDFLHRGLRAQGYEVSSALDGDHGLAKALGEEVSLVVLDMLLPGRSGLEVLETLHDAKPTLPVIVLTALGEVEHRVAGLDAGAVDYLAKPFSLAELCARIRAQLRAAAQVPSTDLRAGDVEVNLLTREVYRAGELIRLSTTEFELLVYLMRNSGRVLSREQILRAVWGYEYDPGTNVVDVYVGYLRRKLRGAGQDDPNGPRAEAPIVTVRSVGYRFNAST